MKALRHPVRRELLKLCLERDMVTVGEAAKTLRHPQYNLRYHIGTLSDCGALKQVGSKMVKGSEAGCWGVTPAVLETNWILEILNLPL